MRDEKLVSIIIPVYNVELYIQDCIDSVLGQSYSNIEVIAIDDASTDSSLQILNQYEDERLRVFLQTENQGQSAARNVGLNYATGDYILFVDSDDYLKKETLNRLVFLFQKENVDMIRFDAVSYYEKTQEFVVDNTYIASKYLKENKIYTDNLLKDFYLSFNPSPVLYIFRRELIIDDKLKFDEGIIHEDELFNTKLYLRIKKARYCSEQFYVRRYRDNSTMTNKNLEQLLYSFKSYNHIMDEYEKMLSNRTYNSDMKKFIKYRLNTLYNMLFYFEIDDDTKNILINKFKNKKVYFTKTYKNYIRLKKVILIIKNKF